GGPAQDPWRSGNLRLGSVDAVHYCAARGPEGRDLAGVIRQLGSLADDQFVGHREIGQIACGIINEIRVGVCQFKQIKIPRPSLTESGKEYLGEKVTADRCTGL